MSLRCKPGDHAYVVNDIEVPRNNGAIVRVVCRANPSEYGFPVDWDCVAVTPISFEDGWIAGPGCDGFGYLDRELRPITPPPGSVTESEVRKLYSGRELVNIVKERL